MPSPEKDTPRSRIEALVSSLPEAQALSVDAHLSLEVRGKRFGWFLDDHHGDGRVSLHLKSTPDRRSELIDRLPHQVFEPSHVGRFGWLGTWLDLDALDWELIEELVREAYRTTAPSKLAAAI